MTNLQLILRHLEVVIFVCSRYLVFSFTNSSPGMTTIVFSKPQQGVNCLLVIGMTLNLNNHFLQPPDSLLAAIFVELVVHVISGGAPLLICAILVLIRNVLASTITKVSSTSLKPRACVETAISPVTLILGNTVCSVSGIPGILWVSGLGGSTGSHPKIFTVDWLIAVGSVTELLLQVISGKVWNIMPDVFLSRAINLSELIFSRAHPGGSLLGSIASNIPKQDMCIIEKLSKLTVV